MRQDRMKATVAHERWPLSQALETTHTDRTMLQEEAWAEDSWLVAKETARVDVG